MGFLTAQDEQAVKREFEKLTGPVKLTVFASELGPETNAETVALIKEVAALSDQISVKVLNPHIDFEGSPFWVQRELAAWKRSNTLLSNHCGGRAANLFYGGRPPAARKGCLSPAQSAGHGRHCGAFA